MGRLDEATQAFGTVRELRPDAAAGAMALADALMRAGKTMLAREQADVATALAEHEDMRTLAGAHEMAARVALADKDSESATRHAEAAHTADASLPVPQFVRGRLLYDEGKYEDAAAQFEEAEATLRERGSTMADLHLYFGESLARLDRYPDAEAQFREELHAYPRNLQAYTSLAMLYRASNRDADVEDVLNELVAATPTPEATPSPPSCGRFSVSARAPRRSGPMRGHVFAAIRPWLSVSRMRGDKQQADPRPHQIPDLSHDGERHARYGLIADARRHPPDSASSTPTLNGTNLKATVTTRLSASNTIACPIVGLRSPSNQRSVRKISNTASA